MYAKDKTTIIDRREMLRVKIKSLADEAKIIRREEHRTRGELRQELHLHRIGIVRSEARAAHIAYGLVRGLPLDRIEPGRTDFRKLNPDVQNRVRALLKKYGPAGLHAAENPVAPRPQRELQAA